MVNRYIGSTVVEAYPTWKVTDKNHCVYIHQSRENLSLGPIPGDCSWTWIEGYTIRFPDGSSTWMIKEEFNKIFRVLNKMRFGEAIETVKYGNKVSRSSWDKGSFICLLESEDYSERTDDTPCLASYSKGILSLGYVASQEDLLADDWYIVKEDE